MLTFTFLWANSAADDKLMHFFPYFSMKLHFLHEMSKAIFWLEYEKYLKMRHGLLKLLPRAQLFKANDVVS